MPPLVVRELRYREGREQRRGRTARRHVAPSTLRLEGRYAQADCIIIADSKRYGYLLTSYMYTADGMQACYRYSRFILTNVERSRPGTSGHFSQCQLSTIGGLAARQLHYLVREERTSEASFRYPGSYIGSALAVPRRPTEGLSVHDGADKKLGSTRSTRYSSRVSCSECAGHLPWCTLHLTIRVQ